VEIRFCPILHTKEGLSSSEAVEAVIRGMNKVKERCQSLVCGVIVCALRSYPEEHGFEMVDLAKKYLGKGVVGFDICGDEGNYPLHLYLQVLQRAISLNIPTTCHAGEWIITEGPNNTINNIQLAVQSGVRRIGHGITLIKNPELTAELVRKNIGVECCLTGNVGKKVPSYAEHPIRGMFSAGVRVSLNCDNLLLSGDVGRLATPSGEVKHLLTELKFEREEVKKVLLNGVMTSFCEVGEEWKKRFEMEIDRVMEEVK